MAEVVEVGGVPANAYYVEDVFGHRLLSRLNDPGAQPRAVARNGSGPHGPALRTARSLQRALLARAPEHLRAHLILLLSCQPGVL